MKYLRPNEVDYVRKTFWISGIKGDAIKALETEVSNWCASQTEKHNRKIILTITIHQE